MDYILAAIIESVEAYKSGVIDSEELLEDLRGACDQIAEQDHICQRCFCYMEQREYPEWYLYGEICVPQIWLTYRCPRCGRGEE